MAAPRIDPALALGLIALLAAPLQAAPKDPPYPSMELLRELQLQTFACGRENTVEACGKASTMADPLLDHPPPGRQLQGRHLDDPRTGQTSCHQYF